MPKHIRCIFKVFVLFIAVFFFTHDYLLFAQTLDKYTLREQSAALYTSTEISNTFKGASSFGAYYDKSSTDNIQDTHDRYVSYNILKESPWYRYINESLANISGIKSNENILEIGAGPGTSTTVLLDKIGHKGKIIVLEPNSKYLNIATKMLRNEPVEFILASAQEAGSVMKDRQPVDRVFMFNTVHFIDKYKIFFDNLSRIIKTEGVLAFNTAYFTENESQFKKSQRRIFIKILRNAKEKGKDIKTKGRLKIRINSIKDYEAALTASGFEIIEIKRKKVKIPVSDIENFYRDNIITDYISPFLTPEEREQFIIKIVRQEMDLAHDNGREYIEGEWLLVAARNKKPVLNNSKFSRRIDERFILEKRHAYAITSAA